MWILSQLDAEVSYKMHPLIGDQIGAIMLAYGVLLGVIARERYGIGQHVEVSQLGSLMLLQTTSLNGYLFSGELPRARLRGDVGNPLVNTYRCGDGKWIMLGSGQSERFWPGFCRAMGVPDLIEDSRYSARVSRESHASELVGLFDRQFATRPREEWLHALKSHGVYCAPVQDYAEMAADPQVLANDYLTELHHPEAGKFKQVGIPVKLSGTPGAVRSVAPEFGEHTERVLLRLDYSWEQIAKLREKRVI